jgi:hypothetical protein
MTDLTPQQFGAVGDGKTDCTAAFQDMLNAATATGAKIYIPPGNYIISGGLEINYSTLAIDDNLNRILIQGGGKGNTQLTCPGSGDLLVYQGSTAAGGAGAHAYFDIRDLRLQGPGAGANVGAGLLVKDAAWCSFRDLVIEGFRYGFLGYDVLSSIFDSCTFSWNSYGITCQYNDFSNPNALTFISCEIGGNLNYGATFGDPTTVNFIGGAFEGNGVGGTDVNRFGVIFNSERNIGLNGAMAGSFHGTYFEGNAGVADIWFAGGGPDGPTALLVQGCTFNRTNGAPGQFVTNNILMGVEAASKAILTIIGNAFTGFGTYVPSPATPYVGIMAGAGTTWDVTDLGNMYDSPVEVPVYQGPAKTSSAMSSAWVRFNGTAGAAVSTSHNVASVARKKVGTYSITFGKPLSCTGYVVTGSVNGVGSVVILSDNTNILEIETLNFAGVPIDYSAVSVAVFGGGVI